MWIDVKQSVYIEELVDTFCYTMCDKEMGKKNYVYYWQIYLDVTFIVLAK